MMNSRATVVEFRVSELGLHRERTLDLTFTFVCTKASVRTRTHRRCFYALRVVHCVFAVAIDVN